MAFDHQEQEQIDELKAWWKQYGNLVLLTAALIAVSIGGYQGWLQYQRGQALAAGSLYDQMEQSQRGGDHKKAREIAVQITERHGSSAYATLAALSAARSSFESGDTAGAKTLLQWVIDRAKEEEARDVARLRLAAVLLDEKKYDEALKLLDAKPADPLTALYADLKGDVLAAQGKRAEARSAYQLALDRSDAASTYRGVIQLKLDALGDSK
jgi:predicted negative regulator of RcsB-dependent stress response